jgi:hypothetical protein
MGAKWFFTVITTFAGVSFPDPDPRNPTAIRTTQTPDPDDLNPGATFKSLARGNLERKKFFYRVVTP